MTKREKIFYKNLVICDEDIERAEKNLKAKGVEKHIMIKEKLSAWSTEDIKYTQIASTYRYDKRIRLVLFKYISYLEEFYRGIILDHYRFKTQKEFWIENVKGFLKEFNNDLNQVMERLEFSDLLKQIKSIPDGVQREFKLPNNKRLDENIKALISLRNAVMHNKFLLLYRGFDICYINGDLNNGYAGLKENIYNLMQFLPCEVAKGLKTDIIKCKENRNNDSDTLWELPSQIIIDI